MKRPALALALIAVLAGCQSQTQQPPALALLNDPSEASLEKIKAIIEEALGMQNMHLSQSVFKETSLLIIERQALRSIANPALFSETELPDHFTLLKGSQGCLIEHRQSRRQWVLENIDCILTSGGD